MSFLAFALTLLVISLVSPSPICLSTAYEQAQTLSMHTLWMLRNSEGSCTPSTMSTHHYFTPLSPDYPNLGQLGQQCNSVRRHSYVYPQHMNMLKYFLYMSGIVQPQLCQQFIILPHHPKITTQIWVNLASIVTVYKCTHMSNHSIRTCSNIFCIYNMDVDKK